MAQVTLTSKQATQDSEHLSISLIFADADGSGTMRMDYTYHRPAQDKKFEQVDKYFVQGAPYEFTVKKVEITENESVKPQS